MVEELFGEPLSGFLASFPWAKRLAAFLAECASLYLPGFEGCAPEAVGFASCCFRYFSRMSW